MTQVFRIRRPRQTLLLRVVVEQVLLKLKSVNPVYEGVVSVTANFPPGTPNQVHQGATAPLPML